MRGSASGSGIDRDLVSGWLSARSIARGIAMPVADRGGWRVDTRSDAERCRYVFAVPDAAIADLARSITASRIFLKLCADDAELAALLPARWHMAPRSWFMTADRTSGTYSLPPGYVSTIEDGGGAVRVAITAPDGAIAASGYAAETEGVFAYDRIVTRAEHQRRGLGTAVMALLGSRRASSASRQALVATDQGQALYATLGWQVRAPYATAVIPDRQS